MAAVFSLLIAITISLLITRIATEALVLTGLSRQSAKFQARSAFTGTGFATKESEKVVNHPVRRRIVMWLMFLGNAGIITVISSLVFAFLSTARAGNWLILLLSLLSGIGLLWIISINPYFNRYFNRLLRKILQRWTNLDVRDYASLLHLRGEYKVAEIQVNSFDWMADKRLEELQLRSEGVLVLGIERNDDTYIGAPNGATDIRSGDILIVYARQSALTEIDSRRADLSGDRAHQEAIAAHQEILKEQEERDL